MINELRIGNYIYDDDIVISKVIGFKPFGHSIRCDEAEGCEILIDLYYNNGDVRKGLICESQLCTPIPLTEDWLKSFGFEFPESSKSCIHPNTMLFELWKPNFDFGSFRAGRFNAGVFLQVSEKIQYVHQLQNLYFALTGEELQISPTSGSSEISVTIKYVDENGKELPHPTQTPKEK